MANRQSTKPAISTWAEHYVTRFWSKVDRSGGANACWLWSGSTKKTKGYGQTSAHGWTYRAHRVSYELSVGPVPKGLVLDHLCRVRSCVNPAHLETVTNRENILRGTGAPARYARQANCPKGHTYTDIGTQRRCLICKNEDSRQRRALKRAAKLRGLAPETGAT